MKRVRFAPSPTGSLHLGSVRTAIVNFLFAKKTQASLVLRIEDTDKQRSTEESTARILENLDWMGITFDEGPYFQSERTLLYKQYIRQLFEQKKAYPCFCPEAEKKNPEKIHKDPCRDLSKQELKAHFSQKEPYAVRLRIPEDPIHFHDLIKGEVSFQGNLLEDFVIARTDGSVTYNFAVVVDDHEMSISHIIRGEDHLSNTPKQVALYQAFDWSLPEFAHIPLILGPDKTKLSKRHCDTAIEDYRKKGFLPETLFNYLALLGYSHDPSDPIQSTNQLIDHFSWEKISRSASQFDLQRLIWMNKQYLDKLSEEDFIRKANPWIPANPLDEDKKNKILAISRNQIKLWSDIPSVYRIFIAYQPPGKDLIQSVYQHPASREFLSTVIKHLRHSHVSLESLQDIIESDIEQMHLKKKEAIQWVRIAVTGSLVSPSLYETMNLLGKTETLHRLSIFLELE